MREKGYRFRLTQDAIKTGITPLDIKLAAAEAMGSNGYLLRPEIHFLRFQAKGRHFALTTRTVIEVDLMPHRTPARLIRGKPPGGGQGR